MITEPTTRLLLALIIPLVGAVLIGLSHRRPNQREAATLITTVLLALDVFSLLPEVLAGASRRCRWASLLPASTLPSGSNRWACCLPASPAFCGS